MSLAKAIAEAIAGGIAGYATAKSGTDFINPLLAGQQQAQDRKARKAESLADREFQASQAELARSARSDEAAKDRKQREELQRASQQFQAQQAKLGRKFESAMAVFKETGDPTALSGALETIPGGGSFFETLTSRVLTATKAVQDRDQRQVDTFTQNARAAVEALGATAKTEPAKFLGRYENRLQQLGEEMAALQGGVALDGSKSRIASEYEMAANQIQAMKTQAEVLEADLTIEAGNYEPLGDTRLTPRQRADVIVKRYGKETRQQETYSTGYRLIGSLDSFNYVSPADIEDPEVRALVDLVQEQGPEAALADLMIRNPESAPQLGSLIDNLNVETIANESSRLGRLEKKRDFDTRLENATSDYALPADAFMVDAESGQVMLRGDGAQRVGLAIESQFSEADNPTWSALAEVDKVALAAGWDDGTVAAVKSAIASDYEFQEKMAVEAAGAAEQVGAQATADFVVLSPRTAAEIREQTAGMGDKQARQHLARLGYDPRSLAVIREGGSVHGRKLTRSVLPSGTGGADLLQSLNEDLTIALAGGQTDKATELQGQLTVLQSVRDDPAVVAMAESTMFEAARAVAHDGLDDLYDNVTTNAKSRGSFEAVLVEGEADKSKERFIEYVNQGQTEGAKVARALRWLTNEGMFQVGSRQQATSAGQQNFNAFLAEYADDYGDAIDDALASMYLGAEFDTGKGGFLGFGTTKDTSESSVALRYLTSTSEEVDEFFPTGPGAAILDRRRAHALNPPKADI